MKLISSNDKILVFLKERVENSGFFYKSKKKFNLNLNLEEQSKDYSSIVALLIECEEKYGIIIEDNEIWDIKTPLNIYNLIRKKLSKDENNPKR